jgi:hypothetical protein
MIQYKRYRNAFVAELNGLPTSFPILTESTKRFLVMLRTDQKTAGLCDIGITGFGFIFLILLMLFVDAHLYEGRHDPSLALTPSIINDQFSNFETKAGMTFVSDSKIKNLYQL